jgi:hypothetical protein
VLAAPGVRPSVPARPGPTFRRQVSSANYSTWVGKTEGLICRHNIFLIGVPSASVSEYLDRNLRSLIEKTIIDVTRIKYAVSFLVEGK